MLRRNLLSTLGIMPFLNLKNESKDKFLIVIHLDVGNLPVDQAKKHAVNIGNELKLTKPDHFTFMVIPHREPTFIEVFAYEGSWHESINLDANEEWLEEQVVKKHLKVIPREFKQENLSDQMIINHVELMFGAPAFKMSDKFYQYVNDGIELGRQYKVINIENFVVEFVEKSYINKDVDILSENMYQKENNE